MVHRHPNAGKRIVKSITRSGLAMLLLAPGLAAQDLALTGTVVLNPAEETVHRGVVVIEAGRIAMLADELPPDFGGATRSERVPAG